MYEPAVSRWLQAAPPPPPRLVAVCPFTDEVVDASLTFFADAFFRVIIADTCRAARVVLTVASNDKGPWWGAIGGWGRAAPWET